MRQARGIVRRDFFQVLQVNFVHWSPSVNIGYEDGQICFNYTKPLNS